MGKTLTDEDIKLNIIVNGNQAQKQLFDLEKATRKLTEENKQLHLQKKLLEKQGKTETDQYKLITATIKANTAEIKNNKTAMSQLQKEIGITGLTMDQLAKKAVELKLKLRHAIPGSEAHKRYTAELGQVTDRLNELSGKAKTAQFSIGGLADKFNRYAALGATVLATLTGFVVSIQKIIDLNAKLSDAQTNVMKTTGMTKKEVDELTKSFGLLKTRTGRIELLGIAEVGGRLGIAKNEIQDFVRVMDKSAVALGDSFEGGPEVVAEKLGRIKGLYEELKNVGVEQAFESVGSAMNDLGADGTASEANIAEFMTRVGALPEVLKPSAKEAAGLGAAFEESGLKAEVAASNYGKVISIASRDFDKFAKVMQRPKKEIENLLNTNPTEFFLQFSQSLKNLDATELSKVLDYLKLNDNEVKMVLGAASQNTDLFRQKIDLAGKSMEDATSLTNEYNLKNNNLAATLDKIKKTVAGWFSSDTFVAWLASAVEWLAELIGATENADGKTSVWKQTLVFTAKIIAVVTAALITNVAWQKLVALWTTRNTEATLLYNIASRARAIADGIAIVATQAYSAVTMLLTGNLKGAAQAMRILSATMRTTPWGLVLGMIAAAATAYMVFAERAEKVNKVQKVLADVHLEASKSIAKEKAEMELLAKTAKDSNVPIEKRKQAIEKLNEIIPDYIGNLTLENIKTAEGMAIIKKYTDELYKNARAKAAAAKFDELAKQRLEVESKTSKDYRSGTKQFMMNITGQKGQEFANRREVQEYVIKTFGEAYGARFDKKGNVVVEKNAEEFKYLLNEYLENNGIKSKEAELSDIDAQMKALEAAVFENSMSLAKPGESVVVPDANPDLGDDDKKDKEKKYDDSYLDQQRRQREELYQLWKKGQEDKIALMKDGYEKELALENLKHEDLIRQNFLANEAVVDLQKDLDKQMEQAVKDGDTKKIASLKIMQGILKDKQVELSKSLEYEESMHQLRKGTIQEKAGRDEVEKLKEKYDQEKAIRETAFLEELASLNLTEEEKAKRKEAFAKAEAKREIEFLEKQIKDYENMIGDIDFNGIDFSLLTPEAEAKLQADIEKLRLAIAKLKEAQGNEQKPEGEIDLGLGGGADVLGFTQEQWDKFFRNIEQGTIGFQTMSMAVGAAQQMFAAFDQYQTASENAQLKKYEKSSEAKKKKLKQQLDAGYINQAQYKKGIEQIDQDLDKKKAEIEYKQAKRQRIMAVANVLTSTAQAIMSIWAQVPKFDFGATAGILTGVVAATGALQLATILKTPLPAKGFEKGLYKQDVMREQDGKIFRADYGGKTQSGVVNKPTYFLTGENGPEMIIDSKAYSQLSPETRNALLREIRGIKGFETGYYKNDVLYSGEKNTAQEQSESTSDDALMRMVLGVLQENTEVMKDLRDSGIMAIVSSKDMKSMKALKEGLKRYESIINKAKQG